ncbi:hybrid sensor histidine kinase/response regulator transcription factor [Sphingobacterium sp. LRF_L2]|uniref:hybrid sensor histidine kinase/response regulator transcription factor n=1 Tax=Sphingobacterium sp. LRF_L2 TaxID=3369421 RepID=UPI003F6394ED
MSRAFPYYFVSCIYFFYFQFASSQQLGITPIKIEQQLPSLTVNRIFQDREGFIWFGTAQGISRFDAFNVLTFKLKNRENKIVTDQNITAIEEASQNLLVGTDNGLYVFNKKTYSAQPFPDSLLDGKRITSIFIDKQSAIWIGTSNAIYVYRSDFSRMKQYIHNPKDARTLPKGTINTIFEDSKGNMWVSVWCAGLFKLDKAKNKFSSYPSLGSRNNPFKILEDDHGQLWIATWGDGLYLFNPGDSKQMYREVAIKNKRRGEGKEELFYNLLQDHKKKYIWVLSFSGISTFSYDQQNNIRELDFSPLFDNTSNIFNDIYEDRSGSIWLSIGGKGISTINFDKPAIRNYTLEEIKKRYSILPNLNMLYRDREGYLWFNLERIGLGKYNPRDNKIVTYSNTSYKSLMAIRAVNCILEVGNQLWVGSSYEPTINIFEKAKEEIILRKQINLVAANPDATPPLFFYADREKNLWIATSRGLTLLEPSNNKLTSITEITDYVVAITEDNRGNIWIATRGKGIYQILPTNLKKVAQRIGKDTPGLQTDQIEALDADQQGKLWIGTKDSRLLSYDVYQQKAEEFANMQLFSKNQLLDIVCLNHTVWLSSSRNIYKIQPNDHSIYEYTMEDGFQVNMFSKRAYTTDKQDGSIFFAGYNGIVKFEESTFFPKHNASVLVSDIKVNNQSVILHSEKQKYDIEAHRLNLEPEDQNLEIDFTSLEFAHANKIRYAYKLEGVDKDWVYAPRERLFATYNNLGKGRYRFLVKATALNNKWSSTVTEIIIRKKPAFYESNLAYLVYFIIVGTLIYYGIAFAMYRLKLRSDLRIAQIEKDKANELIQTKLSYFTNISHDLLTPLTIISCLVDDIQITTKKNLSQFEKMRFNLTRLKRLLQQILDFRRIENQQMELRVSKNPIHPFIEEICHSYFNPLAKRKSITFDIELNEMIEEVYFDVDKLDKIIFNLLSNAFKYTPHGGHIVLSYLTTKIEQHDHLVLQIKDNGIGIAQEEIEKIFIPFYNNKRTKQTESNGIGLALTKELVELHHGNIRVQSSMGKGTCFTVTIPIDQASYSIKEQQEFNHDLVEPAYETTSDLPIVDSTLADTPTHNLHLLLVEDNTDLRQTIQNILSKNYHVYTAIHGREALSILAQQDIDIIISDLMMPEMDGLTLCRTIKSNADFSHIPVILLTAKSSIEDRVACYQAGADSYVSKPFELKVLEARIHSFIINKRTKQLHFKANPEINISTLEYTPLDEQFLHKMLHIIEEHLSDDQFDVIALGDKLGLSKSTLYRKTKVLLDLSPSEFIKNIRLKHACQLMDKDKSISVSEVAFATGFADPRYFSTCFKAAFQLTPSEYQRKGITESTEGQ